MAELKRRPAQAEDEETGFRLHVFTDVAELKPFAFVIPDELRVCLHVFTDVAELKPEFLDQPAEIAVVVSTSSPTWPN